MKEEKYGWFTDEVLERVRNASCEEDAVRNLSMIMKAYEQRKSLWEVIKLAMSK